MAKVKDAELKKQAPRADEEDEGTLAAIDAGLRDADAGRTMPPEKVRELLSQWTPASPTRENR